MSLPEPIDAKPSYCLSCEANSGGRLEREAEGSELSFPLGRVPHVCAGVAGALHGLTKTGEAPSAVLFRAQQGQRTKTFRKQQVQQRVMRGSISRPAQR
jgi:hypothetical protein